MALEVIGVGWGRTATNSMKMALEQLGYGVTHHMWEVTQNLDHLVPLWNEALAGRPDWNAIFEGNKSALDWPTVTFWRELVEAYPDARIVLTTRSAQSWYDSISTTILEVIKDPDSMPEVIREGSRMALNAIRRSIGDDWSREALIAAFNAHEAAVKQEIPAERLLVHSPKDGWGPLCAFLGVPVPEGDYPRSNHRDEFFANMDAASA